MNVILIINSIFLIACFRLSRMIDIMVRKSLFYEIDSHILSIFFLECIVSNLHPDSSQVKTLFR